MHLSDAPVRGMPSSPYTLGVQPAACSLGWRGDTAVLLFFPRFSSGRMCPRGQVIIATLSLLLGSCQPYQEYTRMAPHKSTLISVQATSRK